MARRSYNRQDADRPMESEDISAPSTASHPCAYSVQGATLGATLPVPLTEQELHSQLRTPDLMIGPGGKDIPVFPEDTQEIERLTALGFSRVRKS